MTALTVACLADLHLDPECVAGVLDAVPETYERIATDARETVGTEPDLCVVLGDIVQETSPGTDARLLERMADVLDSLPVRTRVIPGNHDVMHRSPAQFATHLGDHVPDEDGWWVDSEHDFVFLNSAAPRLTDSRGELTAPQQTALRDRVSEMDDALLFCHHPLWAFDLSANPWFRSYPEEAFCGRRRSVEECLSGETVSAIVTGHLHDYCLDSREGTTHVVVDAYNKTSGHGQHGAYALLTRHTDGTVTGYHVAGDGRRREF